MDDYLKWDSVLKEGHAAIYSEYESVARDTLSVIGAYYESGIDDAADGNGFLTERENGVSDEYEVEVSFGEEDWSLTLKAYAMRNGLSDIEDSDDLILKIGASIEGDIALKARDVRKRGVNAIATDVRSVTKTPVAHTGGLAPEWKIDDTGVEISKPAGGAADLNWVTKY